MATEFGDFAVITQNDESKWHDVKGDVYHYPIMYRNILRSGCKVIYYTGQLRKRVYEKNRLTNAPHYFGIGIIGNATTDQSSAKNLYCEVLDYQPFDSPVMIRYDGEYLEPIPAAKHVNYWRSGVRRISANTYSAIVKRARLGIYRITLPDDRSELESYSSVEGAKNTRFSSYYERNPFHRVRAIEIHGLSCMACGFDFMKTYGDRGKGYIHVHHNKPLSMTGPTRIIPESDLSVLCANCHAMVHRDKAATLTVEEVRTLVQENLAVSP